MAGRSPQRSKRTPPDAGSLFAEPADVAVPPPGFPPSWATALNPEFAKPYFTRLTQFIEAERTGHEVYPPDPDVYNAFRYTPLAGVKVVILGQDPYPNRGRGHGLCFSVRPGIALPGSLRNIYRELRDDLGIPPVDHGYLVAWARQGVLLLNAVLTVRAGEPNSHKGKGWEQFTDAALRAVSELAGPVAFVLWGAYAQKKTALIDTDRHAVVASAHPSPLSAANGFFGSRPFSKVNAALERFGRDPVDWRLPAVAHEEPPPG